jgi:hypothetical protein
MENPDFDYSSLLIKIDQLTRKIYQNMLERRFHENQTLLDDLLFTNRQLQLWNKNAQSNQRD